MHSPGSVLQSIAYIMQKAPYVVPIVGGRKVEHLMANVEALSLDLTEAHVKAIEDANPYNPGYPWDITVSLSTTISLPMLGS